MGRRPLDMSNAGAPNDMQPSTLMRPRKYPCPTKHGSVPQKSRRAEGRRWPGATSVMNPHGASAKVPPTVLSVISRPAETHPLFCTCTQGQSVLRDDYDNNIICRSFPGNGVGCGPPPPRFSPTVSRVEDPGSRVESHPGVCRAPCQRF